MRSRELAKQVVLPSGRSVAVVYFERTAGRRVERTETGLHVCPECAEPFVHPTEWAESGPAAWKVNLRCPNCRWSGGGVYSEAELEVFDRELDRGSELLAEDLERLVRLNMEQEIERLAHALANDHILPEDF